MIFQDRWNARQCAAFFCNILLCGAAALLPVSPAMAEDAAAETDEDQLQSSREIVVQADIGYRNRAENEPEPVLVYGEEYFQRFEPLTAGDALKRVPSVTFLSDVIESDGAWRFAAGQVQGALVAKADGKQLVMDAEGLALLPEGTNGGWLVVSSQGDNAYALYRLPGLEPAGRFRIVAGRYGAAEETDGIALAGGNFGPDYPAGLFVAQDGHNAPAAQNFKLVSWRAVLEALGR